MSEENRKWLEKLIKDNKESSNELTYTYCPFEVLYQLQEENKRQQKIIDKITSNIQNDIDGFITINDHGECNDILELLEIYLDILKEVEK